MWFKKQECLVCKEKDARIQDLLDQVSLLREVAYPSRMAGKVSPQALEADKILSGNSEPIEVTQEELEHLEASNILSGMYSSDQIEVV